MTGLIAAAVLSGCAKNASEIPAAYVSPYQYENWTCLQLADEAARVNSRAARAAGMQDEKATRDAVATTVAVVIFWPALFFVGGNDQQTAELAQLRGQAEAIEISATHKRCGMGTKEARAERTVPEAAFAQAAGSKPGRKSSARRDGDGVASLPYGLNTAD
jgi:hypothetical protein